MNYAEEPVSFLNEIETEKELCSHASVSFFNELDTENRTMLSMYVSFLMNLTQKGNYAHNVCFIF